MDFKDSKIIVLVVSILLILTAVVAITFFNFSRPNSPSMLREIEIHNIENLTKGKFDDVITTSNKVISMDVNNRTKARANLSKATALFFKGGSENQKEAVVLAKIIAGDQNLNADTRAFAINSLLDF